MSIHDEFDSLFDDISGDEEGAGSDAAESADDMFSFDEDSSTPGAGSSESADFTVDEEKEADSISEPEAPGETSSRPVHVDESSHSKKRSSDDFEPDMDALLITAQSSLIIEGMRYLKENDYTSKTLTVYLEALKGVELYIKILERNPNNYHKLEAIINMDLECKEVEKIAFQLYNLKFKTFPETDEQKLKSFEVFRNRLRVAYYKSLISTSMISIKKYFLLSGGLDQDKISQLVINNNTELKSDVAKLSQHIKLAIQMTKSGNYEITRGMKGKDVSIFIIKASQLLAYFYLANGNKKVEEYYRRMHENYKKYFVVR